MAAHCTEVKHEVPDDRDTNNTDNPTPLQNAAIAIRDNDPTTLWRAFVQRFPVLSLYAPLWDGAHAGDMSPTSPLLSDPHVASLARALYPTTAAGGLREAAILMHGFGTHAPAVMEAIRLGARAGAGP